MRELDRKESWELPRIDAFELWCWRRLLRIPWTARRPNQLFLKEINPKYSLEDIDAEAEAPILWPPDVKRPWCWERLKAGGGRADEMVGWHHRLDGHEFEQDLGDGEGRGSLACCSPWGCKELNMTEWLNNEQQQAVLYRASLDMNGFFRIPDYFIKLLFYRRTIVSLKDPGTYC